MIVFYHTNAMSDLVSLEEKLTHLEKHISEQDLEIFRLRQQLDEAITAVRRLGEKVVELQRGGGIGSESSADVRPPHY